MWGRRGYVCRKVDSVYIGTSGHNRGVGVVSSSTCRWGRRRTSYSGLTGCCLELPVLRTTSHESVLKGVPTKP